MENLLDIENIKQQQQKKTFPEMRCWHSFLIQIELKKTQNNKNIFTVHAVSQKSDVDILICFYVRLLKFKTTLDIESTKQQYNFSQQCDVDILFNLNVKSNFKKH